MGTLDVGRAGRRALVAAVAVVALGLVMAATAGATTYSWTVPMSSSDVLASHLPAPAGASGSASISGDTAANRMCGTFTWSGVAGPVVFGHIHQGAYGNPEDPAVTINFFGPDYPKGASSGVSGCTIVPGTLITQMAKYPEEFMVTIHTQAYPWGPIRGQLGGGGLICQLKPSLCPGPF